MLRLAWHLLARSREGMESLLSSSLPLLLVSVEGGEAEEEDESEVRVPRLLSASESRPCNGHI